MRKPDVAQKQSPTTCKADSESNVRSNPLKAIEAGALLLLRRLGKQLVAAQARKLLALSISDECGHLCGHLMWEIELPTQPSGIADTSQGVIVAWTEEGRTVLALAEDGKLSHCVVLPGEFKSLTSSRNEAWVATQERGRHSGRLWRVDIARCTILAERPLPGGQVDIQSDVNGQWLTISDPSASTVMTMPGTLTYVPPTRSPTRQFGIPEVPLGHHSGCCCCACKPSEPIGGDQPGGPNGQTGGDQSGKPGSGHPGGPTSTDPTVGPQTGTVGVPTGGGGTVVGRGGRIGQSTPGDDGKIPCELDLLWQVTHMRATAGYVVAHDAARKNLAVIGFNPLRLVEERQFGRSAFQMALDREAPVMVIRDLARKPQWSLQNFDLTSKATLEIDRHLPVIIEAPQSQVFFGLHTESLMGGHAPTNGPIKTLILPIIEKSQSFTSPDISTWAAYVDRTLVPGVLDYYNENSFGLLKDITFQTFGRDFGPKGGPLVLPRNQLGDYYWPKFVAATLILTRTAVPAGAKVVLDGRETMTLNIQPQGLPAETMDVPFTALAFDQEHNLFPVQLRFFATDILTLKVITPAGASLTLNLNFSAKAIDIDTTNVAAKLTELTTYLEGILQAAESAAGLTTRLFAPPVARRVAKQGDEFGRLVVTVNSATTTGQKLSVVSAVASTVGTDSFGLNSAIPGTIAANDAAGLQNYMNLLLDLATAGKGFDENTRRVDPAIVVYTAGTKTLTTTIPISGVVGGPAAQVSLKAAVGLDDLFSSNTITPNSATTSNNAEALRDADQLFIDVFTAASQRLLDNGRDPNADFSGLHVAMLIPVDLAISAPGDAGSVQPFEQWSVTELAKPVDFRGVESYRTVSNMNNQSIQLKAVWTLDFFLKGKPDVALICHELGHGLGFRDLYSQTGYREDLAYLDTWAIMSNHPTMPHHAGYHKRQAGWITDDRVITIPPTDADQTSTTEAILVPVEVWDRAYPDAARAAFAVGPEVAVVQLVRLDLGGDGAVYDMIEVRQKGVHFSQHLPGGVPSIVITNAIEPWDDQRYAFNGNYRRELQLLNQENILTKAGDSFDMAKADGLPAKGIIVTAVDRKLVLDATMFRVKVTRTNTDFIDLYFSNADPYYKNTDLWVDWAGDNASRDVKDHHSYPLGQPVDQGEVIRVPNKGEELHWLVARLRNRGKINAEKVVLNFKICVPPGGGDRSKNFQSIGTSSIPDMPGSDVPMESALAWNVPAGFGGHTCIAVEIQDYKIPKDSDGVALASDDVWIANNHAQKNVDQFIPLSSSPFEATAFDYGVHNDAPRPEIAYLEPDGLPYGMKLTVTPPSQIVPPKTTVIFHCKLELDDTIIAAGCRSDRQFRLVTWRRDPESTTRWGGVQYKVRPRKRCATTLTGFWSFDKTVELKGAVTPNPGGGIVRIRLAFDGVDAFWVPVNLANDGTYIWSGSTPATSIGLEAVADFEGNSTWGPARSPSLQLQMPRPPS